MRINYIVDDLTRMNAECNELSSVVLRVWDNVGAEYFGTTYIAILRFFDENSLEQMKQQSQNSRNWWVSVSVAGLGLDKDAYDSVDIDDDATINEIVEQCIYISTNYRDVSATNKELKTKVSNYIKIFEEANQDKANLLHDWYLESSLYADSVLDPSGSYASNAQNRLEYIEKMKRFQKEANSFE